MRRKSPWIAHRVVGGGRYRGKTATNRWLPNINQVGRFVQYKLQRADTARLWRFCPARCVCAALSAEGRMFPAARSARHRAATPTSDSFRKIISGIVARGRCCYQSARGAAPRCQARERSAIPRGLEAQRLLTERYSWLTLAQR
jgi:hypothetical protein